MPYSRNVMSPITNVMPCPRDILAAVIAKLAGAPELRALASRQNLLALCESTPEGAVPLIDGGTLTVLTSRENLPALESSSSFGTRKLTLQPIEDGVGIFANFPDAVTTIRLDPGTPSEASFSGKQLASLRDMARSVAVTRVAQKPAAYDAATFRRIMRDHRRFVVPLQPMTIAGTAGTVTSLSTEIIDGRVVPYEILRHERADGTHYAVVFSWEDCAEAFFAALGSRTRTVTLDGEALFRELRRIEDAYGATSVVLDMEGPTPQSWLKIGAWKLVLD